MQTVLQVLVCCMYELHSTKCPTLTCPIVAHRCAESTASTASPSVICSQGGALVLQPVLSDQRAPLLELVPLLGVALHDISHAVSAECDNIAQLLAPSCLSPSILLEGVMQWVCTAV